MSRNSKKQEILERAIHTKVADSESSLANGWFASLVDLSADPIISISNDGIIRSWNKAAGTLFGYSSADAINSSVSALLSGDKKNNGAIMDRIIAGEIGREDVTVLETKSGDTVLVTVSTSVIKNSAGEKAGISIIFRDVTATVEKNRQIEKSYNNLRAIFENAQEGFVLIDREGTIREFNAVAQKSILLNHSTRQVERGHSILEHIDQTRREFFKQILTKVLDGEPVQYDKFYAASPEESYWFSISLNAVHEADKITGIAITGIDITTRKRAEEGIEAKEKFYRTIVENSGDAVTIFSADARQLFVSPSIKNILGYSEEESLEVNIFNLIHPEDVEGAADIWTETFVNPGQTIRGHIIRILHKDGTYRWMENTVTNLVDDPIIGGIVSNFKDITDKIEADQELRDSQERYRYLFYNNPLPMWIFDPETYHFLEINNAAISKYGYTREEFLQMTIKDIRPDDEVERLIASMNGRMEKDYNNSGTWEHITKSGAILDVEISSHPVNFENRQSILVLANDITDKKKATRLLLKVYQEKSNILESIRDGFMTINKDWQVTYFNKEAENILKKRREDILGKNIWEEYPMAKDLSFYTEAMRAVEENAPVKFEEYFPPLDLWLDVSVYPSEDGITIFFKDVTDKKQIEENVKMAKERYEIVSRVTNQAVYEWDVLKNVTYWNEEFETIFGHRRTEEAMPASSWMDNLHPDEKESILKTAQASFANRIPSYTREFRFRCADGSYKLVADNLAIIYNENGPVKIIGAMQDITEKKKQENQVRELNEQLNRRALELAVSNQELERFAYVASHDLQEPLRMVSSFLQLLQKKYENQLDETAAQYIHFAVDGAERMKRLILDLLEYSRVGTNKDLLVETDMNGVMSQILKNYTNRITEREAMIRVNQLPTIKGNKTQLIQLLQNLISNAIKYNTSFIPEVEVGCEDKGDVWQFYVKDNGIGVDKKFFEKIFVIFQRLHNRNQFSGTGIGLAICKKIVDRHNGKIWVESENGNGSTFFFTIKK